MKCHNCNNIIPSEIRFCPFCGASTGAASELNDNFTSSGEQGSLYSVKKSQPKMYKTKQGSLLDQQNVTNAEMVGQDNHQAQPILRETKSLNMLLKIVLVAICVTVLAFALSFLNGGNTVGRRVGTIKESGTISPFIGMWYSSTGTFNDIWYEISVSGSNLSITYNSRYSSTTDYIAYKAFSDNKYTYLIATNQHGKKDAFMLLSSNILVPLSENSISTDIYGGKSYYHTLVIDGTEYQADFGGTDLWLRSGYGSNEWPLSQTATEYVDDYMYYPQEQLLVIHGETSASRYVRCYLVQGANNVLRVSRFVPIGATKPRDENDEYRNLEYKIGKDFACLISTDNHPLS